MLTNPVQISPVGEREIVMTRVFNAPRQLVFECWTKPELVRRWLTGPEGWAFSVCEIDLRVGGAYRYVWRHVDGREMGMGGVYHEIAAPERLVTSEIFDEDWTGGEAVCTLLLTERHGQTLMTNSLLYATAEARAGVLRSGMETGLAAGYARLDALLAEAAPAAP